MTAIFNTPWALLALQDKQLFLGIIFCLHAYHQSHHHFSIQDTMHIPFHNTVMSKLEQKHILEVSNLAYLKSEKIFELLKLIFLVLNWRLVQIYIDNSTQGFTLGNPMYIAQWKSQKIWILLMFSRF